MALKIDFSQKYSNLIIDDLSEYKMTSPEDRGGYLAGDDRPIIPEKYRRKFLHPDNGFVSQYCEEYEYGGIL